MSKKRKKNMRQEDENRKDLISSRVRITIFALLASDACRLINYTLGVLAELLAHATAHCISLVGLIHPALASNYPWDIKEFFSADNWQVIPTVRNAKCHLFYDQNKATALKDLMAFRCANFFFTQILVCFWFFRILQLLLPSFKYHL